MSVDLFYSLIKPGVIKSKIAGRRVFYFSAASWAMLEQELPKTFGQGGTILLRHLGAIYGENIAKEALSTGQGPTKAIEMIAASAAASGWGSVRLAGNLETGEGLTITMDDCIFCAELPKDKAPHCHFLDGLVSGIASQLYGKAYSAEETKCMRSGAPSCTFEVRKGRAATIKTGYVSKGTSR